MASGLIGGIGDMPVASKTLFNDYDISLQLQTEGVDNWQPYSTAGTDCYVYDYDLLADYPTAQFDANSVCSLLPRGTITQQLIEGYSWINASESVAVTQNDTTKNLLRIYSFKGKPNADINLTLRIHKRTI